jgi:membrane associated rhomboid family serine protease
MGATVIGLRARGADPMATGLPMLLGINLLLTFAIPGISIGGHLGGLVAGSVGGFLLFTSEKRGGSGRRLGAAACAAVGVACGVAALVVA